MKKLIILMATVWIIGTTAGMARALTNIIDFEDLTPSTDLVEIVYPDVTFTYSNPALRLATYDSWGGLGPPLAGITVTANYGYSGDQFVATFSPTIRVNQVQVVMGDSGADQDNLFLYAYDKDDNLLASDNDILPEYSNLGVWLSVESETPIAYVKFNSTGAYLNTIFFDNFTYSYEAADNVKKNVSGMLYMLLLAE
jgi:hypothetical protein